MIKTEQNNIKFKVFQAKQPKQILLCLHGFAGDKESSVIEAIGLSLQNKNVTTIAFDWPCHGEDENGGILRLEKCLEYLSEVINKIRNQTELPINIFATSFGAYLFLHFLATSDTTFKNIILRSPAVDMEHIIYKIITEHKYDAEDIKTKILNLGYTRKLLIDKHFVDTLKLPISIKSGCFVNIIQGKKDELIDCDFNEKYFMKYFPSKHKIYYFVNADHRYKNPGEKEKIVAIVKDIILKTN